MSNTYKRASFNFKGSMDLEKDLLAEAKRHDCSKTSIMREALEIHLKKLKKQKI